MDAKVKILAPTLLEWWAVRRTIPGQPALHTGIALQRWRGAEAGSRVIVCGLAGALSSDLLPGTVVIPEVVELPEGTVLHCDAELVQMLIAGARGLGLEPATGPLLTAATVVTDATRQYWAARGFVAADMETGLLAGRALRVATVRVILDTPQRPIAQAWERPARALVRPTLWRELLWLTRAAPRYALQAAHVLEAGLNHFYQCEGA
jgi:4-hydroxy-3-methylbut-2-enyl diphosphate reductase